jgi:hypothetical protein
MRGRYTAEVLYLLKGSRGRLGAMASIRTNAPMSAFAKALAGILAITAAIAHSRDYLFSSPNCQAAVALQRPLSTAGWNGAQDRTDDEAAKR